MNTFPKRENRSHYTLDRRPKKAYKEKDAIIECYRMNANSFSIHQVVCYKCITCGKFHIGHTNVILTPEKRLEYKKKYILAKK